MSTEATRGSADRVVIPFRGYRPLRGRHGGAVSAPRAIHSAVDVLLPEICFHRRRRREVDLKLPCPRRPVMPPKPRKKIVPLTVDQVRDLAVAMPPRYRAMIIVQAGLGLRIGEVLGLQKRDIDFLHRTVSISRQVARCASDFSAPKTPSSVRTIPLPDVVATALAAHMQRFPPRSTDGLIFTTESGGPVKHAWHRLVFNRAVEEAGLPKTTSHDLRDHLASILIDAGHSVVAVASALGHDDGGKLVLSTYAHLFPDQEDRTRKAVDLAWRGMAVSRDQATTL